MASGGPKNTISPPRSPGPGPMSRMRSAANMICGSCSTTTSELPASRSRCITCDDAAHVARVQADRRLVEHEQRVHQRGAERGGEVDALHLAAGERARLAIEREVAEPDLAQIAEARADLGEQQLGRLVERRRQGRSASKKSPALVDRQQHQVVDRRSVRAAQAPEQRVGLEPRAVAGRARRVGAVLRQQHADVHLVGLGLEPGEEAPHAVPGAGPGLASS